MIDSNWGHIWSGISGMTVAYILLATILLWFVIGSHGKWWLKGCMIAVTVWFGTTLYYSMQNFMGWPTVESVTSQNAELLYFKIREPSKSDDDPGAIYLWVRMLNNDEEMKGFEIKDLMDPNMWFKYSDILAPRAYKLPYTRETHEELENYAKQQREKGARAYLEKQVRGEDEQRGDKIESYDDNMRIRVINPEDLIPKN